MFSPCLLFSHIWEPVPQLLGSVSLSLSTSPSLLCAIWLSSEHSGDPHWQSAVQMSQVWRILSSSQHALGLGKLVVCFRFAEKLSLDQQENYFIVLFTDGTAARRHFDSSTWVVGARRALHNLWPTEGLVGKFLFILLLLITFTQLHIFQWVHQQPEAKN